MIVIKLDQKVIKTIKERIKMEVEETGEFAEIVVRSFSEEECKSLLDYFVKNPSSLAALQSPA